MRSFLVQAFEKLFRSGRRQPVLGRWGLLYDEKKVVERVDYANEDHCHCSEYLKAKIKERDEK